MGFETFKDYYATTMMHYQRIEHDIKLIYAFMLKGNTEDNLESIDNKTLGTMIRILEKLDYSDNKPFISRDDYKFLKDICDKRNYWAHQAFVDFIYKENPLNSKEYKDIGSSLESDSNEVHSEKYIVLERKLRMIQKKFLLKQKPLWITENKMEDRI